MPADLPIFGIFGRHESGKTTLIEELMPRLLARGLSVAVAKVHGSRIEVDRLGKDSDRLYRAGADVLMHGRGEGFVRLHLREDEPAAPRLADLAGRYDLVLVEGRKRAECPKVWLLGEGETAPPTDAGEILAALPRGSGRAEAAWSILEPWLARAWLATPVYGCILIGGRSTRMGTPKHLLARGGRTWIEQTADLLRPMVERVAVVGAGQVPEGISDIIRLPDVPDAEGPMAGLVAAMRWAPRASWLVAACDLPNLSSGAIEWLLSTRAPGVWATLPRLPENAGNVGRGAPRLSGGRCSLSRESRGAPRPTLPENAGVEPLLAHYDFRAHGPLEALAAEKQFSLSALAGHPKVVSPEPPADMLSAWRNVNTPNDLDRH